MMNENTNQSSIISSFILQHKPETTQINLTLTIHTLSAHSLNTASVFSPHSVY